MPDSSSSTADTSEALSFEEALERLESIVETLEEDVPPLQDAVDVYAEGMELAEACLSRLDAAEQRIQELSLDM
jgi:exodeoxyribonuclease VII small subunit